MSHPSPATPGAAASRHGAGVHAVLVASGILLSRLFGLVRVRVFSHYLGQQSDAADAFNAAFRIPNTLQNLFGEGAMSASFIPVYARLLAGGDEKEAARVAGAIAGLLALLVSLLIVGGVLATPWLIDVITPGFHGAKRDLAIRIVRTLFPGAGLLVLSAWCLGILNSHRRFFLSYAAPVIWNVAMIATLVAFGNRLGSSSLVVALAWGSVAGTLLQVVVQLPTVLRVLGRLRLSLDTRSARVRTVLRNFLPVLFSRGVVQISAYVDGMIASLLPTGAMTGLANAQLLYILPISVFGMSVSAAELPAMSSALGDEAVIHAQLRRRLDAGLQQIAFFVVPTAVAFLALGDVVAGAILQTGRFTRGDTLYVWGILVGPAIGLLAATLGRLYSSTYYALGDTRTPLRFAALRVSLAAALGYLTAVRLPPAIGLDTRWGVAGLTASAAVAGWVEFALLRSAMGRRIGRTGLAVGFVAKLWLAAVVAAGAAWAVKLVLATHNSPVLVGAAVLTPYAVCYFGLTILLGIPQATALMRRLRSK